MPFSTIKTDIINEENNRKTIEEELVQLQEDKKILEEKIRKDIATGEGADPTDESTLTTLGTQIGTKQADLTTSLNNMDTHLASYNPLDPWDSAVIGSFDDNTPILLMPVRIETRFEKYTDPNDINDPEKHELWVRIFPDDLAIETHEKLLTQEEKDDGQKFWDIFSTSTDDVEKKNAWNTLCVSQGMERAAYIAKYFETGTPQVDATKKDDWTIQARTRVMPDKFVVYLYHYYDETASSNTPTITHVGNAIPHTLKVGINPNDPNSLDADSNDKIVAGGSEEIKWMIDFDEAIAKGMGMKIPLTLPQYFAGFNRVTVLGIKNVTDENAGQILLQDLFEGHHYTNGFSILKQGINTNNTEDKRSGYSSFEFGNTETYKIEREGVLYNSTNDESLKSDGQRLAEALGIKLSITQNIHGANGYDIRNAMVFNDVMYAGTIGNFCIDSLHPVLSPNVFVAVYNPLVETRKFFREYVSGRGAIPSIRIGTQPYGILPISTKNMDWGSSPDPEAEFYKDMYDLTNTIDESRNSNIGGTTIAGDDADPQQVMADILGRTAVSTEYYQRVGAGAEFIWNQLSIGDNAMEANNWQMEQQNFVNQFQQETGLNFTDTPNILKTNFRPEEEKITKPIVSSKPLSETKPLENHADGTENYIHWIRTSNIADLREQEFTNIGASPNTAPPNALLYDYLRQSILLEYYELACDLAGIPYNDRRQKEFINMEVPRPGIQTEQDPGEGPLPEHILTSGESRWAVFDSTPQGWNETIGQHIDSGMADNNPVAENLLRVKNGLTELETLPTGDLSLLFSELMDVCSYRLDSWKLGIMTTRLKKMRFDPNTGGQKEGIYLGAYGWIEDIKPINRDMVTEDLPAGFPDKTIVEKNDENKGYIHAPSLNQASTAALLRSGYEKKADNSNDKTHEINLSSERVRTAKYIIQGINNGVSLDALLGYEFERGLHDRHSSLFLDKFILPFRDRFKITSTVDSADDVDKDVQASIVQSQNVVNGYSLVKRFIEVGYNATIFSDVDLSNIDQSDATHFNNQKNAVLKELKRLAGISDAVSDLGVAEGAFQVINGNHDAAGALPEALSGGSNTMQVNVTESPKSGLSVTNRIALTIEPIDNSGTTTARAKVEPSLNAWIGEMLPPYNTVECTVSITEEDESITTEAFGLQSLSLEPLDLIHLFGEQLNDDESDLSKLIKSHIRSKVDGSTPSQTMYNFDTPISIDYGTTINSGKHSFKDILPLLKYVRKTVENSKVLSPMDFKNPGSVVEPNSDNFDYAEFYTRVNDAVTNLTNAKNALKIELDTPSDSQILVDNLGIIAQYNVEGAIPECNKPTQDIADFEAAIIDRAKSVLSILTKEYEDTDDTGILDKVSVYNIPSLATPVDTPASNPPVNEYPEFIKKLNEITELIFGKSFKILPHFKFDQEERKVWNDLVSGTTANTLMNDNTDDFALSNWVSGVARVRPKVANLEFVNVLHDTFNSSANCFNYEPVQFPYDGDSAGSDRWMALKVTDDANLKDRRISILFNNTFDYKPIDPATQEHNPICGLLVDEWVEVIPNREQQTGVAFHYDQPNAKAPQCLLLALPQQFTNQWEWVDLLDTVNQTFDDAKKRAQDYEALQESPYGQMSPMNSICIVDGDMTF